MTIPSRTELRVPVLECMRHGEVFNKTRLTDRVAEKLGTSADDLKVRTKDGDERVMDSRTWHAMDSMIREGLVARLAPGQFQITEAGLVELGRGCPNVGSRDAWARFRSARRTT